MTEPTSPSFATLVQEFFTDYMVQQRALSPCTVASYRDTFVLLLRFAQQQGKDPNSLELADISTRFLADFLDHLEQDRHNSVRSRNIRLAAVRSFLKFASGRDPAHLRLIEQALAVPMKRFDRKMVGFLPAEQMRAVIDAPDDTWIGQRDRLMLTLMFNTGARVSEVTGIRVTDVVLGPTSCVRLHGKGRKQRSLPLWKPTAKAIRVWLHLNSHLHADAPLLPRRDGKPMTRANVAQRLKRAVRIASQKYPDLTTMSVSPHMVRHATAMSLLQSGVDLCQIALWLGHETPTTTHMYVEADLAMKERALSRLNAPQVRATQYRPPKALMAFLHAL